MAQRFAFGPCPFVHGTRMPCSTPGFVARYVFAGRLHGLRQHALVYGRARQLPSPRSRPRRPSSRRLLRPSSMASCYRRARRASATPGPAAPAFAAHPPANCRVLLAATLARSTTAAAARRWCWRRRTAGRGPQNFRAPAAGDFSRAFGARQSRHRLSGAHYDVRVVRFCVFAYRVHVVAGVKT